MRSYKNKSKNTLSSFYIFFRTYSNEILLAILLLFSFVIRVANFNIDAIYLNADANRLYLIDSHIIEYGEFPSVGASTGYLPELKRSPAWYYLTSAILLIKNDIVFLGWINIFLSILTIIILYILARVMFGKTTALIAAILFSFSQISFEQAIFYIWEPFITQTLLIFSLLMFLLSYQKNNYFLLLFGIFIFNFASALYHSAFFVLPVFIFLIIYILRKQKRTIKYFFGAFGIFLISFLFFYLPVLLYHLNNTTSFLFINPSKGIIKLIDFLPELGSLFYVFSDGYFLNLDKNLFSLNNLLFSSLVGGIIYTFLALKNRSQKKYYYLIVFFILIPLIFIALFKINKPFHDPQTMPVYGLLRYVLLSIVLFIILVADVINSIFSRYILLNVSKIFVVLIFIYVSFPPLLNHLNNLSSNFFNKWQREIPQVLAVEAIKGEVYEVKQEERFNNFNFFSIYSYEKLGENGFVFDLPSFWVKLEKDLNIKLVTINNKSTYTYEPIRNKQFTFLVCYKYIDSSDEETNCIDRFKNDFANYSIIKHIYSQFPYSIYVTKKV